MPHRNCENVSLTGEVLAQQEVSALQPMVLQEAIQDLRDRKVAHQLIMLCGLLVSPRGGRGGGRGGPAYSKALSSKHTETDTCSQ